MQLLARRDDPPRSSAACSRSLPEVRPDSARPWGPAALPPVARFGLIPTMRVLIGGHNRGHPPRLGCPLRLLLGRSRSALCVVRRADPGALRAGCDLRSELPRGVRRSEIPGRPWFFFNMLVASMVLVVLARNGVLVPRRLGGDVARLLFPGDV